MVKVNKLWGCLAIGCLALVACGGASGTTSGASKGPLVIGATFPLTGSYAAYGETWKNGTLLAADEINAGGGLNGRQIKVQIEDFASDTAKGVQAFTKLADVDKAPVILGGASGAILAQAPVANRDKVVLLNIAAQPPEMRKVAGQFLFSNINDANAEAADLVRYMKEDAGISAAIIYYVDDATGKGQQAGLALATKTYSVRTIDTIAHSLTDENYRTLINKMKSENPPAVLVGSHWEQTGYTLKQAAELGFSPKWFGLSPTVSDTTVNIAGKDAIEGMYTVRSQYDALLTSTATKKFIDNYKKKYKADPDIYAAHAYDAVYQVKQAALAGATDGASFAKELGKMNAQHPFKGVSGEIAFDKDHMVRQPGYIFQVKAGKLVLVKKVS